MFRFYWQVTSQIGQPMSDETDLKFGATIDINTGHEDFDGSGHFST